MKWYFTFLQYATYSGSRIRNRSSVMPLKKYNVAQPTKPKAVITKYVAYPDHVNRGAEGFGMSAGINVNNQYMFLEI